MSFIDNSSQDWVDIPLHFYGHANASPRPAPGVHGDGTQENQRSTGGMQPVGPDPSPAHIRPILQLWLVKVTPQYLSTDDLALLLRP